MKQKALFLLFISFTLATIGSVMLTSCILENDVYICDIEFGARDSNDYRMPVMTDTTYRFKDEQIGFRIVAFGSRKMCFVPSLQFFSSAYAMTESYTFLNALIIHSYELFLDKPMDVNGVTYPANTNLLEVVEIYKQTNINQYEDHGSITGDINFDSALVAQMEFDTGVYEVRFKCRATDGKSFEKTTQVYFK